MKFALFTLVLGLFSANTSFAGCPVYKDASSWEQIGYLSEGVIYENAYSYSVKACLGTYTNTVYSGCYSSSEVGYLSLLDGHTIYKSSSSDEVVGFISLTCSKSDFKQ